MESKNHALLTRLQIYTDYSYKIVKSNSEFYHKDVEYYSTIQNWRGKNLVKMVLSPIVHKGKKGVGWTK